jgi:hypothetical protein
VSRRVRWPHGEAYLSSTVEEWPASYPRRPALPPYASRTLPATGPGWPGVIAVRLVCQTAGAGCFFASACGSFTPRPGPLEIECAAPDELSCDPVPDLLAGAERCAERPQGRLQLWGLRVHLVDFQASAWRWCGALVVRLACQDAVERSDEALEELALELRLLTR